MITGDYFFLVVIVTIAGTRLLVLAGLIGPTVKGFRVRHYMYGVVLIILAFFIKNLTLYAVGFAWVIDELPLILWRGPGFKNEQWRGVKDYWSRWCIVGVFILIFLTMIFRNLLVTLI